MSQAPPKTIYFFRETPGSPYAWLSQWYPIRFTDPGIPGSSASGKSNKQTKPRVVFENAEQYMMYRKAVLFGDHGVAARVLETGDPRKAKALGRKVGGFVEGVWIAEREGIVERGCWCKFMYPVEEGGEGKGLRDALLGTGDAELVEASPRDGIWGIGFAARFAEELREEWGLNLLGKCLMRVRERIRRVERGEECT